jgi:hypothetical protein
MAAFPLSAAFEDSQRDSEGWRGTDETAHELFFAGSHLATFLSGWK